MKIIERNAINTRRRILMAAQEEMFQHGYQGMRIEAVLQNTGLAKGALYHHFSNKLALGYAVVEELMLEHFTEVWSGFVVQEQNPINALQKMFLWKTECLQNGECFNGCPLNNLIQEMAARDKGFHERLQRVMNTVIDAIAKALMHGQTEGYVRSDLDAKKIAVFIHCCYQGVMGTAKCSQAPELLADLFSTLNDYLDTLRVQSLTLVKPKRLCVLKTC